MRICCHSERILLLNSALTVGEDSASHMNKAKGKWGDGKRSYWESFTDAVIKAIKDKNTERPVVFMAWGRKAQSKSALFPADEVCSLLCTNNE